MEFFLAGGILQRSRTAFLGETRRSRRALLLGEGPGRFLAELLRANAAVQVFCVDRSPRMIAAARNQLAETERSRVQFVSADALTWRPEPAAFDLIVTHYFLDCFRCEELAVLVAKIAQAAKSDACWLLADFHEPENGWQRWRGRVVLALMYGFFRLSTGLSALRLTSPDAFLLSGGFRLKARRFSNFRLVHTDLWERKCA